MKTPDELERLKRNWEHDACWDIENTEGFEDHREELLAFRKEKEAQWEEDYKKHRAELASKVCPVILFGKIKHEGSPQTVYENSYCLVEKCAWWDEVQNCCAIKTLAFIGGK